MSARQVLANRSGAAVFLCYHSIADGGPCIGSPFLQTGWEA